MILKIVKLLVFLGLLQVFCEFIAIPLINIIFGLGMVYYFVILGKK